ncbi:hypothetical protein Salat_2523100 [Sesamum alatum]|uniref:Uncharacterized protein n=1 Tax=Sesamum alatum TaxID=300844 RepID=A0AAE2CCF2_9LAMI|nr:hypothetical protein Salat_2523100 [Sesamum alatum]
MKCRAFIFTALVLVCSAFAAEKSQHETKEVAQNEIKGGAGGGTGVNAGAWFMGGAGGGGPVVVELQGGLVAAGLVVAGQQGELVVVGLQAGLQEGLVVLLVDLVAVRLQGGLVEAELQAGLVAAELQAGLLVEPVVVGRVVIQVASVVVVCTEEDKFVSGVAAVNHMDIGGVLVVIIVALAAALPRKPKPTRKLERKSKPRTDVSNHGLNVNYHKYK